MTDGPRATSDPRTRLPGGEAGEPPRPTPAEDLAEALEEAFGPPAAAPSAAAASDPGADADAARPASPAAPGKAGDWPPDGRAAPAPPEGREPAADTLAPPAAAGATAAAGGPAARPSAGAAATGHMPLPAADSASDAPAAPTPASAGPHPQAGPDADPSGPAGPPPTTPARAPARGRAGGGRRGSADPVRGLMYRHRDLCRDAVDPLEIAAGLEAHGVTDRTAVRYRHRDVFSLAEEMYVRTRRPAAAPPAPAGPEPRTRLAPLAHLLPLGGGLLVLAAAGLDGRPQAALTAAGVGWAVVALVLGAQRGALRVGAGLPAGAGLAVGWLLAYAVYGDWFLGELLGGATGVSRAPAVPYATAAALAGLTASVLPAAAVARWFAARARGSLRDSRDLAEFRARVRPLLAAAVAAVLAALVALQLVAAGAGPLFGRAAHEHAASASTYAAACALGALLFLARLLAVHGFPRAAAYGVAAACAAQVTALLLVLAARVPGLAALGRPVELLVAGPAGFRMATVPAAACGAAALALLAYAGRALTRASAHRKEHNEMTAPPLATPSSDDGGAR